MRRGTRAAAILLTRIDYDGVSRGASVTADHRAVQLPFDTQLQTSRLLLRPARPEDAVAHFEAARESLVECGRWLSWCVPQMTLQDSEAWVSKCREAWLNGVFFSFYIFDRADGGFVGCITINELDEFRKRANLGYWIRTGRQGVGFATEVTPTVARFGFERLGLMRIEIVAASKNVASRRVATKVGATREGLARNRLRIHGVQHDAYVFSLIPGDLADAAESKAK
jgi:ribosomal-protein-serine acetyltransferase